MILERNAYESNGLNSPRTTLEFSFRAVPIFEASQFTAFLELNFSGRRRQEHGVFLHRELRIRLAQRVLELESLPSPVSLKLERKEGEMFAASFRKGPICFGGWSPGWSDLFCEQPRYRLGERSGIRDVIEWYTGFVHLLEDTQMGLERYPAIFQSFVHSRPVKTHSVKFTRSHRYLIAMSRTRNSHICSVRFSRSTRK